MLTVYSILKYPIIRLVVWLFSRKFSLLKKIHIYYFNLQLWINIDFIYLILSIISYQLNYFKTGL